jgi:hypothetical protein
VAILANAILATGILAFSTQPFSPEQECCDHLFYRSMAFNSITETKPELDTPPAGNRLIHVYGTNEFYWLSLQNGLAHQPPYAYRMVSPILARALSYAFGSINPGFYVLSLLALTGAAFVTGLVTYKLTDSLVPAIAGVLAFVAVPTTHRFNLWHYMLTDPMAFLLAAVATLALVIRRRWLFFACCFVGVFNKESMVPMLLCYPLYEFLTERRVRSSTVGIAAGIAAVWLAFRELLPVPVDTYSLWSEFRGPEYLTVVATQVLVVFGVLLLAVWRGLWSNLALALTPFAALQLLSGFLVGQVDRAVVQAIPFVIVAVLWRWPRERPTQALVLLPVGAYLIAQVLAQAGFGNRIVLPPLALIVLIGEALLLFKYDFPGRRSQTPLQRAQSSS